MDGWMKTDDRDLKQGGSGEGGVGVRGGRNTTWDNLGCSVYTYWGSLGVPVPLQNLKIAPKNGQKLSLNMFKGCPENVQIVPLKCPKFPP